MKKSLIATMLVFLITLSSVGSALAQRNKINVKGEVTAAEGGTLTVESNKGETYIFTIPDDMDTSAIQVGDSVLVKATAGEVGNWIAESIKVVGPKNNKSNDDEDEAEGSRDNSAFCADDKQERPHPLASKIAERYGVTEELVMDYYCEGYSIGAIMLAIKTSQLDGISVTLDDLLADRADGNGWGQIWKELGLIGSEKNGHSPPGLLNRPDHAGPKNKD